MSNSPEKLQISNIAWLHCEKCNKCGMEHVYCSRIAIEASGEKSISDSLIYKCKTCGTKRVYGSVPTHCITFTDNSTEGMRASIEAKAKVRFGK